MHFHEWKILYLINISSWKFVSKVPLDNNPSLVWIMAWRRRGDKSLSELMLTDSLTHICYIRVRRIKWSRINIVNISQPYICFLQVEICVLYVTLMWYVFQVFIFIWYIYIFLLLLVGIRDAAFLHQPITWNNAGLLLIYPEEQTEFQIINGISIKNIMLFIDKNSKFHCPALQGESFISCFIVPSQFLGKTT